MSAEGSAPRSPGLGRRIGTTLFSPLKTTGHIIKSSGKVLVGRSGGAGASTISSSHSDLPSSGDSEETHNDSTRDQASQDGDAPTSTNDEPSGHFSFIRPRSLSLRRRRSKSPVPKGKRPSVPRLTLGTARLSADQDEDEESDGSLSPRHLPALSPRLVQKVRSVPQRTAKHIGRFSYITGGVPLSRAEHWTTVHIGLEDAVTLFFHDHPVFLSFVLACGSIYESLSRVEYARAVLDVWQGLDESEQQMPYQALEHWMLEFPEHFTSELLHVFSVVTERHHSFVVLSQRIERDNERHRTTPAPFPPSDPLNWAVMDFHAADLVKLAEAICLLNQRMFARLRPTDYLARLRHFDDEDFGQPVFLASSPLAPIFQWEDLFARWIVHELVATASLVEERTRHFSRFIDLGFLLFTRSNFFATAAVIRALCSPPVRSLVRTQMALPVSVFQRLQLLTKAFSPPFSQLEMPCSGTPCLPSLGPLFGECVRVYSVYSPAVEEGPKGGFNISMAMVLRGLVEEITNIFYERCHHHRSASCSAASSAASASASSSASSSSSATSTSLPPPPPACGWVPVSSYDFAEPSDSLAFQLTHFRVLDWPELLLTAKLAEPFAPAPGALAPLLPLETYLPDQDYWRSPLRTGMEIAPVRLTAHDWHMILSCATRKTFERGHVFLEQGRTALCAYRVITGEVQALDIINASPSALLSMVGGPNTWFGFLGLLECPDFLCYQVKSERVEVWEIPLRRLRAYLTLHPLLNRRLSRTLFRLAQTIYAITVAHSFDKDLSAALDTLFQQRLTELYLPLPPIDPSLTSSGSDLLQQENEQHHQQQQATALHNTPEHEASIELQEKVGLPRGQRVLGGFPLSHVQLDKRSPIAMRGQLYVTQDYVVFRGHHLLGLFGPADCVMSIAHIRQVKAQDRVMTIRLVGQVRHLKFRTAQEAKMSVGIIREQVKLDEEKRLQAQELLSDNGQPTERPLDEIEPSSPRASSPLSSAATPTTPSFAGQSLQARTAESDFCTQYLHQIGTAKQLPRGHEMTFMEIMTEPHLWVVRSGALVLKLAGETVSHIGPGSSFGEQALLNDLHFWRGPALVIAAETPSVVTRIRLAEINAFFLRSPRFEVFFWRQSTELVYRRALFLLTFARCAPVLPNFPEAMPPGYFLGKSHSSAPTHNAFECLGGRGAEHLCSYSLRFRYLSVAVATVQLDKADAVMCKTIAELFVVRLLRTERLNSVFPSILRELALASTYRPPSDSIQAAFLLRPFDAPAIFVYITDAPKYRVMGLATTDSSLRWLPLPGVQPLQIIGWQCLAISLPEDCAFVVATVGQEAEVNFDDVVLEDALQNRGYFTPEHIVRDLVAAHTFSKSAILLACDVREPLDSTESPLTKSLQTFLAEAPTPPHEEQQADSKRPSSPSSSASPTRTSFSSSSPLKFFPTPTHVVPTPAAPTPAEIAARRREILISFIAVLVASIALLSMLLTS